jgi:hypothetical protein
MKETELEINPPKELCKDRDCKKGCKCKEKTDLEKITALHSEVASGIIRRIERYVKEYPNDMLLGENVRKLFL